MAEIRDFDFVAKWYETQSLTHVALKMQSPQITASECEYTIISELIFEPDDLSMARVELWLTESGAISLGFDTIGRLQERLQPTDPQHSLARSSRSNEFLGGFEPSFMTQADILDILDAVRRGHVHIRIERSLFGARATPVMFSTDNSAGCFTWTAPVHHDRVHDVIILAPWR